MASNQRVLTPKDVLDIYDRAWAGEKQSSILKDHVVSQATVTGIKRGYYHNTITGHERTRPLSSNQERTLAIYSAYWVSKRPVPEIAAEFGLSLSSVYDIRNGKTGANLTGHPNPKQRKPKVAK